MPLTLEEQTKLVPLATKAADLIVKAVMEEDSNSEGEFKEIRNKISAISPFVSELYVRLYNLVPDVKSRRLDYLRDNI